MWFLFLFIDYGYFSYWSYFPAYLNVFFPLDGRHYFFFLLCTEYFWALFCDRVKSPINNLILFKLTFKFYKVWRPGNLNKDLIWSHYWSDAYWVLSGSHELWSFPLWLVSFQEFNPSVTLPTQRWYQIP